MMNFNDISLWKSVSQEQWNDWRWQMRNKVKSLDELASVVDGATEMGILERGISGVLEATVLPRFGMEVSPHLILQIKRLEDSGQKEYVKALLQTVLSSPRELEATTHVQLKGEGMGTGYKRTEYPGLPRVLRRLYNDRLVFCLTFRCPTLCRYCFRQTEIGEGVARGEIEEGFQYIRNWNEQNPSEPIEDIVFTGGDPLSLSDSRLQEILQTAKAIERVEALRIDTKYPVAIPQRITPELSKVLRQAHPLYMTLHFTHPGEFSPETEKACQRLADAGIPLGTYTPLLKGINDNAETLKELFRRCRNNRIRPYYLVHFIETEHAQHFKTSVEKGLEILDDLHGNISGISIPQYIVYLPDGGGKVIVSPNYLVKRTREGYWFRNWQDKLCLYPYPVDL